MNEAVGFLENIYMMDGYDLWLRNDDINLENVKEDINSKMKMDIISEMKDYNKRYASLLRSPDNTSLSEAYFSSNMESETKSYVKKFISGLNNLEINENVSPKLKDYAYKFMINSSRYLEEENNNTTNDGIISMTDTLAPKNSMSNNNKPNSDNAKASVGSADVALANLEKNIKNVQDPETKSQLSSLLGTIAGARTKFRDAASKIDRKTTEGTNTSQSINKESTEYYHKYVNLKKIMEDENNLSPTETLVNNIYEKVNSLKNSGADMNSVWMKVQDNVPQVKGKTFQQTMVEFKNNTSILNNILANLQ